MTNDFTEEFGEIFPEHVRQADQMREINAEARKLADFGSMLNAIGFPPDRMHGFVDALNANARQIAGGQTQDKIARMVAANPPR